MYQLSKKNPNTYIGKILSPTKKEEIDFKLDVIRENLCALNIVSLAEALAYYELGEIETAQISLKYYADFINKTYLNSKLLERLDMIDCREKKYWSKTLSNIEKQIHSLPYITNSNLKGGNKNETKKM